MSAKEEKEQTPEPAAEAPKRSLPLVPLAVGGLNFLLIVVAIGALYYTRFVFKRPVITEQDERERIEKEHAQPLPPSTPALLELEPITVNIRPNTEPAVEAVGARLVPGKNHFVTVAISLEVRDAAKKEEIETYKPILVDKLISVLGRKTFQELTTVQGRYLLKSQIMDQLNEILSKGKEDNDSEGGIEAAFSNIYFSQFTVQ